MSEQTAPVNETTTNTTEDRNGTAQRDAQGRFVKGNRSGRGNPFACRVAALRKTLLAAVSKEDLQEITRRLVAQAKLGDVASAKLVLGYALGKIPEPVNPDTLYQEECRMYLKNPTCADVQEVGERRPPAEMTAGFIRALHIMHAERARQQFPLPDAEAPSPAARAEEPQGADVETAPGHQPAAPVESRSRSSSERPPSSNGRYGRNKLNAGLAPWSLDFGRPSTNGRNGKKHGG